MRDRMGTVGPVVAVVGAVGICCGLPVLLSLGLLGAVAGMSLQSWALIGVGLVLVVLGWVTRVRRRRCPASDVNETTNNPLKENHR
jgi:type IV secretory pathway TrbD component